LGVLERAPMQRDRSRLIAPRGGEAAVQAPQSGQARRRDGVAERVGGPAQGGGGLLQVVLQQPGLGQQRPDLKIAFSRPALRAKGGCEQTRSLYSTAAFERSACSRDQRMQGGGGHGRQYTAPPMGPH